jgi:DNA replication and repair protein RecF
MKIKTINIKSLRNHSHTRLDFSPSMNIFYGLNGAGKTTILEAISMSSLTKSFTIYGDDHLIKFDFEGFTINAELERDRGTEFSLTISKLKRNKKCINSSFQDNMRPKDVIGLIPIIILSPDAKDITFGSPENRRKFIDSTISQVSSIYLDDLYRYNKVLKQRNNLLKKVERIDEFDNSELKLWTEQLINIAVRLIKKRAMFIEEIKPSFVKYYSTISDKREDVSLNYKPNGIKKQNISDLERDDLLQLLTEYSEQKKEIEFRRQTTMFGPHKDELELYINEHLVRDTASQGQHKSVLISLKLSEFDYIRELHNEIPIVLLDDIFSELDEKRIKLVLEVINNNLAQAFVTITELDKIKRILNDKEDVNYYKIEDGKVKEKK